MPPLIYELAMLEAYSGPFSSLVTLVNPPAGSFPNGGYQTILTLNPSDAPVREPSIQYNPPRNYVMRWDASVERTLAPNLTLLAAYVGSRGVHMFSMTNDVDIVTPTYTAQGYLWPSPVGSGTRLNPNVGSIRQLTWGDSSNYNSLQTLLQRRYAHGFQLQGAFTWQKSIDGYSSSVFPTQFQNSTSTLFINRHLNRGLSDFDVRRVATVHGLWQLPKVRAAAPVIKSLINGWEMGSIFTISDGMPFTPLISDDAVGEDSSGSYDVPNRVVGSACTDLTNPGNLNQYINLACYSFPVPATLLGNAGRNSLIGPGGTGLFGYPQFRDAVPIGERQVAVSGRSVQISRTAPISNRRYPTIRCITPTAPHWRAPESLQRPRQHPVKSNSRCGWSGSAVVRLTIMPSHPCSSFRGA